MKKLNILTLFLMILLISCSTTKVLIKFEEPIVKIYDVNGTKNELFINANRWMISIFKDARSVIQYSDKTEGILMGKYLLYYPENLLYSLCPEIYAIIEITVKDNKVKISINPDNYFYTKSNYGISYWSGTQDSYIYSKEKALVDIDALCESFNSSLQIIKTEF